jgi:hypothetical protein
MTLDIRRFSLAVAGLVAIGAGTLAGQRASSSPPAAAPEWVRRRAEIEKQQGAKFNAHAFHDFVLGQGLLPPRLLRKAVMEGFIR